MIAMLNVVAIAGIAVALISGTVVAAEPATAPPAAISAAIEAAMARHAIPGASIAVIADYRIAWAAGFGLADAASGRPVDTSTRFQAASVSKPLTAAATIIAAERAGIDLDEDINAILARLMSQDPSRTWTLPNQDPTAPVTLRGLLSHTGGTSDFHYRGYRYGYALNPPAPIDPLPSLEEELTGTPPANTPAVAVIRKPGTWDYSAPGYTVVEYALTGIEREPFDAIMDDLILTPLGMTKSTFRQPTPPTLTPEIAVPYLPGGAPLPDGPRVFVASASGGLTTTPTDLAKFVIAVERALAGETVGPITPAIAAKMMERQPGRTLPGKCFPAVGGGEACETSWGLGLDVNLNARFEHMPDGAPTGGWFGHGGFNSGYLSLMLGSKTGGKGFVAMINVAPEDMSGGAPQFAFLTDVAALVADAEGWR
jgi:CubicO group peptidase (beta-lactamase class C family)